LARESSAPEIGVGDVGWFELGDVIVSLHSGPVAFEDGLAERVTLALEDGFGVERGFET